MRGQDGLQWANYAVQTMGTKGAKERDLGEGSGCGPVGAAAYVNQQLGWKRKPNPGNPARGPAAPALFLLQVSPWFWPRTGGHSQPRGPSQVWEHVGKTTEQGSVDS